MQRAQLLDLFAAAGWTLEVQETQGPGHATVLAREAARNGLDLVVSAGGDGTINETVNGIAGSGTALAIIPVGTTNVWARELGLSLDPLAAARELVAGTVWEIDLGRANDRYFLLMAGVGFDGNVMRLVTPAAKHRFGIPAYLFAGVVTALSFRSGIADLYLDGRRLTVSPFHLAVLGNTRRYAVVEITSRACADDGLLDVCIFSGGPPFLRRVLHFANVMTGRHIGSRDVSYLRAQEVRIETDAPMPVQLDGDFVGFTPMRFAAVPRALRVLVPSRPLPIFQARPEPTVLDARTPSSTADHERT